MLTVKVVRGTTGTPLEASRKLIIKAPGSSNPLKKMTLKKKIKRK